MAQAREQDEEGGDAEVVARGEETAAVSDRQRVKEHSPSLGVEPSCEEGVDAQAPRGEAEDQPRGRGAAQRCRPG